MQFICKICISLYIAYIAFICTPHFADDADEQLIDPSQKSETENLKFRTDLGDQALDG